MTVVPLTLFLARRDRNHSDLSGGPESLISAPQRRPGIKKVSRKGWKRPKKPLKPP